MLELADRIVQIPTWAPGGPRQINCLNVAAAAAVALYYLYRGGGGRQRASIHPRSRRPEVLILGPGNHVEAGSTIRSAGALGWDRLLLDDRSGVWFGCERAARTEGRAAARRARNPIRIVPSSPETVPRFDEVCVVTTRPIGTPIHRANLARGARQLIVLPDERSVDLEGEPWDRIGARVGYVRLDLPTVDFVYHFRLIASIALAEVARQVGRPLNVEGARRPPRAPSYDRALKTIAEQRGELLDLEDLIWY